MQKAIQMFEQDFVRWGLHLPSGDVAARSSGLIREAGWHVLYDFGQDSRGEFLDYYAALRDGSDAAVTDDWHVRIYDTGDRVPLPTVLEAYMYSRDPTPDELARARRKCTDPRPPTTPAPIVAPKAPPRRPMAAPPVKPASPFAAALPSARTNPRTSAATASADATLDIELDNELDNALAGVAPGPEGDSFANWLLTPALRSPPITFEPPAPTPAPKAAPKPAAKPVAKPAVPEPRIAPATKIEVAAASPPAPVARAVTPANPVAPVTATPAVARDVSSEIAPDVLPHVLPDVMPDFELEFEPDIAPDLSLGGGLDAVV